MAQRWIPFNKPWLTGNELSYIRQAVEVYGHLSGNGPFTHKCSRLLEAETGAPRALLTPSCTHALEMCALLLDLEPGDEVILPSFAFVTTANAFVSRGATPVFVDVRPDTLGIDEQQVAERVGPRTRAIVALHYGGVACEMDELLEIGRASGVPVVEDNAHGLFARYRGRPLGSLGDLATQSFHETKNLTCGEGGALLVNREPWIERAEVVRDKGTNRAQFYRGRVDRYTWVDVGSSYLASELQAAFLWAQLEAREEIQRRRRRIWERYTAELADWAEARGVTIPAVPADRSPSYHMFYVKTPTPEFRKALMAHLESEGILAVFHFLPLHLSKMGLRFGGREGQCPVSEDASERVLRLPFFNGLTESEQSEVIDAVRAFGR